MAKIQPRWEWRTFGVRFAGAEARLAKLDAAAACRRATRSTCSPAAGDNVKVRDALMDIKVLREVDADGLEQWTPVMKAGFPLPAADVAKVFESLRLPGASMSRDGYTLDELLASSRAGRRDSRRQGAQAADALHGRRLHGRALRRRRRRQADPHDRGRVRGRGRRDRAVRVARPRRLRRTRATRAASRRSSTTRRSATR